MEIREFAERVLFEECLQRKLAPAGAELTDVCPGSALTTPSQPGRPETLRFGPAGERASLPSLHQLDSDEDRARLLHFFANHELLAAELMALVLLKFPDAPKAFRLGVAKTLQEEQMHTRLYLKRLEECGSFLGAQPVNGFFWKSVSTMASPADYVSRLSLTFEQANLDFSRFFAQRFEESGDAATAKILDRIYRDEIAHVSYGLKWFRQWKAPGESDWESFRHRLAFPLSPSRAKGQGQFNREGRRLAGLDDHFIDHLEVYTQSKGRTPNVYLFNPQAEWSIAASREPGRGGGGALPGPLASLASDLSALTLYLARPDDVAIVARKPRTSFLQQRIRCGVPLPEIQELGTLTLKGRKLGELRPWAWSPDSDAVLASLKDSTTGEGAGWCEPWAELHSKMFSARLGQAMGVGVGIPCEDEAALEKALSEIEGAKVIKAPFGVAGKGARVLVEGEVSAQDLAWARGVLATQGGVVVEPWIERVFDFSVQYDADLRLRGYVQLHNDARGRFRGCAVGRPLTFGAGEEVTRFFYHKDRQGPVMFEETLPAALRPHLERMGFRGPLGVDAMVGRAGDGRLEWHPLVEINPRMTMGRVALELARRVVKGTRLRFEILSRRDLKRSPWQDWSALAEALEERHPVATVSFQDGGRRIEEGVLALNDPGHAKDFLALLRVGQSVDSLLW